MSRYVQFVLSLFRKYGKGSWKANLQRLWESPIIKNAISLYGIKAVNLLIPLITIPYVARVLGAAEWGKVVFAKSFAVWVGLIIEYGFRLSGTREIADNRSDPDEMSRTVSKVVGGQLILLSICLPSSLLAFIFVPLFSKNPLLFVAAVVLTVSKGVDPIWYFQGVERLQKFSIVKIFFRLLGVVAIFSLVKDSNDGPTLLMIQAVGYIIVAIVTIYWMYSEISFSWPSLSTAINGLREGWSMFLYRSSSGLFKTANSFILGLFAPSTAVGLFGAAEKIAKVALGFLNPISQAIYPRINNLIGKDEEKAKVASVASMALMGAAGLALGIGILLIGPFAIRFLLGAEYTGATPALRVFAFMIPIVALSNSVGLHRMLPLRMDASFNWIFISAGILNVLLAAVIAPFLGAIGMAIAVLTAETFVLASMLAVLKLWGDDSGLVVSSRN